MPYMERVTLKTRDLVFDINEPIRYVYFVNHGVVSVVSVMSDGNAVETATIGFEGMVGMPVFHRTDRTVAQAFCQVPGDALRMSADAFRAAVEDAPALTTILHRYAQALFTQVAQSSACNRLHTARQRCARWLLQTHDRAGSDEFALTQDFLAQMLGVRRATVSEVAARLQDVGLIRYVYGRIAIVDRPALEEAACECYSIIRREYDRLIEGSARSIPFDTMVVASDGQHSTLGSPQPHADVLD